MRQLEPDWHVDTAATTVSQLAVRSFIPVFRGVLSFRSFEPDRQS